MKRTFKWYNKGSDGSATIETVLWLPFLILFFVFTAEVSNIFFAKTKMEQIVTDANRLFSVGVYTEDTKDDFDAFVLAQLADLSENATYTSVIGSQRVSGEAVVPVADLSMTGFFASWLNFSISANATQYVEY